MSAIAIPEPIVREHIARLVDLMKEEDLAAVLLFSSPNMLAFTGTPHSSSDRLTCGAVTREGRVVVVCPAFERPACAAAEPFATITTWEEHEDAYARFAQALGKAGVSRGTLGVDGRIWLDALHTFEQALPQMKTTSAEPLLREVRICKSPAEQDVLREAQGKGEPVFLMLRDELMRAGVREVDLADELTERFEPAGIRASPLIQSGPNGSIPHNPTGERVLREGDNVVVDSVVRWKGYHNDLTRTFVLGEPSAKAKKAYKVVREAQQAAIDAARPGVQCQEIDRVARDVITKAGFGEFFAHRLGHGMGLEGHEPPYFAGGDTTILRPGMCITVEPGVYVPGEFGVRIEDDLLITDNGCEVIRHELATDVTSAFDA